jgi:hypothetical protein
LPKGETVQISLAHDIDITHPTLPLVIVMHFDAPWYDRLATIKAKQNIWALCTIGFLEAEGGSFKHCELIDHD